MSEVYQYHEKDEGKPNLMALLIEGIRAASYGRTKPTSLAFSSRPRQWDFVMEPGIAIARRPSRKPVRHEHGLHELGFISESTVDSGDVGMVIGIDPGVGTMFHKGKIWQLEDVYTPTFELDPTDPDPLGTSAFILEEHFDDLRKKMIESMGLPASFLEPVKKSGIGRYYSESFVDAPWPGYYSFEET